MFNIYVAGTIIDALRIIGFKNLDFQGYPQQNFMNSPQYIALRMHFLLYIVVSRHIEQKNGFIFTRPV